MDHCLEVQTWSSLAVSLFLIQILPCPWGSMRSGKRDALVTMIPFWIDSSSLGSPCMFHSAIWREKFMV